MSALGGPVPTSFGPHASAPPPAPRDPVAAAKYASRAWTFARTHWLAAAVAGVCAAAVVWQAREYMPFFVDDSFISLRYVWRLLHGHGLTWTDGERVEGYSDLLWVLLVAGGGLFSKDLIGISRAIGVGATALTVLAMAAAYRPRRPLDAIPPLAGGLAMTLTSPVVAWSIGGLEQPLLGALIAWATITAYRLADAPGDRRAATRVGVLLGLACLTRPDAPIFVATTCAGLLVADGFQRRTWTVAARIAAVSGFFVLGQILFRRAYYHAWVPNTAHVKLAFTAARVSQGWDYVGGAIPYLRWLAVLALGASAAALAAPESRRRVVLPIFGAIAWTAYVVAIGGDISPARRHLVPTIVLLSMIVAEGLYALAQRRRAVWAGATAFAALSLVLLARAQNDDPEKEHAKKDTWVWSGRDVGRFLSRAFAEERPLVAVDAAGSLPYFAPELPCLDMLGLNDRVIATTHPADFGTGYVGHELGNGDYILSRKPDLIAFHNSLGDPNPTWRGGREMVERPEFASLYRLVTFETRNHVQTHLWVRREDGRLGTTRREGEVVVPGYLAQTPSGGVAELDPEAHIAFRVDPDHPAFLSDVRLGPGRWKARIEVSGDVDVSVMGRTWRAEGTGNSPIALDQRASEAPVTVIVNARNRDRAYLLRAVFEAVRD